MTSAFGLVRSINTKAHRAGIAGSVAQFENLATHAQYRVPYDVAMRYVVAGSAVLDWGCGNGHFSMLLRELGARVTGYSFEPVPRVMSGDDGFTFVAGGESDPRTIPFPAASFDCVCSVGVLEHVWETGGDEPSSLAEIARVMRPGAVFLTFHLPNRLGWVEPAFRAVGLLEYYHRRRYDRRSITQLYEGAGLQVVEMGTYNFFPRNQLTRLPRIIRGSALFARLYSAVDELFSFVLGRFATNYYVVARK
jgi:SAM-dependent methyltransferase